MSTARRLIREHKKFDDLSEVAKLLQLYKVPEAEKNEQAATEANWKYQPKKMIIFDTQIHALKETNYKCQIVIAYRQRNREVIPYSYFPTI